MSRSIRKVVAGIAALAAFGLGGSMIAQAQNAPVAPVSVEKTGGPDADKIQSGDQTTPDKAGATKSLVGTPSGTSTAPEAPGTETPASAEKPDAAETPSSESAIASDGPGGHADEANGGDANAQHDFQGGE